MRKGIIAVGMVLTTIIGYAQQGCTTLKVVSRSVAANCYGGEGKIYLDTVQGGSGYGTYTYEWSYNDSIVHREQNLESGLAGPYTVSVTDANNCIVVLKDTIKQPNLITITSTVNRNDRFASITNEVVGGVEPYTYEYFKLKQKKGKGNGKGSVGPRPINNLNNLDVGYYRTRTTDNVGCTMETVGWVEVKDVDVADKIYLLEYPNPIDKYAIILYKVYDDNHNLRIASMSTYETIYDINLDQMGNKLEIETSTWLDGTYIIYIYNGRRIKKSVKVLVKHK